MSPRVDRPEPPYLQVVNHIRRQIVSGELGPGDHAPSERQIVTDWDVSRSTATKVLAALRSEGLVESVQGVGTVVRPFAQRAESPRDRFSRAIATGKIYNDGERARIVEAGTAGATADLAEVFGVAEGDPLIRRTRVTYRDDVAVSSSVSWFNGVVADVAPRLLTTERIPEGTASYVAGSLGTPIAGGRDDKSARGASAEEAGLLSVDVGSPVMAGRNLVWSADGTVLEYGESVRPAGHWSSSTWQV